jgi:hypothetical protein
MSRDIARVYRNFISKYEKSKGAEIDRPPQTGLLARKNAKPKMQQQQNGEDPFSVVSQYVDFIREQRMKNGKEKDSI